MLSQRVRVSFHAHIEDEEMGTLNGVTHLDHNTIHVSRDACEDQQAETYLHEVLHVILRHGRLLPGRENEKVVGPLAVLLLHAIRENPRLMAYLMQRPVGDLR
jgi:hypothetical protein